MRGIKFRWKNENTIFTSGNQNAKSGFETEKPLTFFPNSSFANSDRVQGQGFIVSYAQ